MAAAERNQVLAELGIQASRAGNWTWWQLNACERYEVLSFMDAYCAEAESAELTSLAQGRDPSEFDLIHDIEPAEQAELHRVVELDDYLASLNEDDDSDYNFGEDDYDFRNEQYEASVWRDDWNDYANSMGGMNSSWSEDR